MVWFLLQCITFYRRILLRWRRRKLTRFSTSTWVEIRANVSKWCAFGPMEQESQCVVKARLHIESGPQSAEGLPEWSFDGSSGCWAEGFNGDVRLLPRTLFGDALGGWRGRTALCETFSFAHRPGVANWKLSCSQVMEGGGVQVFRIGRVCRVFVEVVINLEPPSEKVLC